MRTSLLLLVLLAGCGAPALTIANHVGLVVQISALACDWGQTRRAAEAGWPGQFEENLVMGPQPTPRVVDAYFASTLALSAAAWLATPRRWRWVVPVAIVVLQTRSIVMSQQSTHVDVGICGLR